MKGRLLLAATPLLLLLGGCSGSEESAPALPPRPVLTMVVEDTVAEASSFSGTIEPRYETDLAFRTLGRIVSRDAGVGDQVTKGQQLAALDAETLAANVRSAEAQAESARAQAETARASATRAEALFADKALSQAELDTAEQGATAADAGLAQARADLDKARTTLSYAILTAPFDGVITGRTGDVGQVVNAGATVMTIARTDVREAVVDIPSELIDTVEAGAPFTILLQTDPSITAQGKVREVAPEADALTRSNRVRILLDAPPAAFRLGTLITAQPERTSAGALVVPRTSVLGEGAATSVWVVTPDGDAATVHQRTVELGDTRGAFVEVTGGLKAGERIAVAGVHSLKDAQRVSLNQKDGSP
ncbi:efflux RND transporter periplasmic adaptor subunit [Aurantimonas sp. MSK8Z-1]|uniref:efflux RND transporter periplasmic adaptor subunit n=1 Tax=Mangrovibrevibacter kandeliae TaxID=2968473 RepID=UPI002118B6DD|nr:efflux RND transporter periplasmic adaptor subunit [Aurantimonas sp. MSK8Z-1]MCW4116978.1 efflux RND transporter periplasmic adaptor subunit [Aurantimonas sp. MSK8Z-1]